MQDFFKRKLCISERWIIKASEIENNYLNGVKVFIFIDDFLGTGDQFEEFLMEEKLMPFLKSSYLAYTPLVAYVDGVKKLNSMFPELHVSAVELLNHSYSLFDESCECFNDGYNDLEKVKLFYFKMLEDHGINIYGPDRRGYGSCELAYAFSHAIPDNCLPILWYNGENWNSLFDR